jgi:hypothetical protein
VADRQHKHRDLWVGLAVGLPAIGMGLSLSIWAAERGTTHVGFWSHAGEVAGLVLIALGILLAVAVVRGWWLPGGFQADPGTHAPSAAPVNSADWIAECDESEDHHLLFRLRHRFENQAAIMAFGEKRCTVTDPDGIQTAHTGRALFASYHSANFPGAPPVRNGTYSFVWEGRGANGTWHYLAEGAHEVADVPALTVMIIDSQFENWKYLALIAALRVQITNATGRAVQLRGFGFTHDPDGEPGWLTTVSGDEQLELGRELHARKERQHYGIPLRNYSVVPPHESVTGWVVEAVTRHASGTPRCIVMVEDSIGNKYQAVLPKQEAQTYGPADGSVH